MERLLGLHHMSAMSANILGNIAFYTDVLGLRLVKKTVNQDNVRSYHIFYGDEIGRPGTELTFFDIPHLAATRPGTGQVGEIELRVNDEAALAWWHDHLTAHGVTIRDEEGLHFTDPEGLQLALVADGGEPGGVPWSEAAVPVEHGIKGMNGVELVVRRAEPTLSVLTDVLRFEVLDVRPDGSHVLSTTGDGAPGTFVTLIEKPDAPPARIGRGGVHHIAFRTPNGEEQQVWQERVRRVGLAPSPIIDRFYFQSVYFREPGGILFEIATDGPGFATDEDTTTLGETLALPPFLEPRRADIEANLQPIETGRPS